MSSTSPTISEATLRELLHSGAVVGARVIGQLSGYCITVRYGAVESTLKSARGEIRLFTLDSACAFLGTLGISKFEVDSTNFEPGRMRKPRPDRAEALRKTRTRPIQENPIQQ